MVQEYRNQVKQGPVPAEFGKNYVDAESMGANVWAAIGNFGQEAARFAAIQKKRQDDYDAARVAEAKKQYNKGMSQKQNNPKDGLRNTKGKSAQGSTKGLTDYSKQLAGEIGKGLDNDTQKDAFNNIADEEELSYVESQSKHEATEMRQYEDETYESSLQQNLDSIPDYSADDQALEARIQSGFRDISARFPDAPPEKVQAAQSQFASTGTRNAIEMQIQQGNAARAQQMLDNTQYLSVKDRTAAQNKLKPLMNKIEKEKQILEIQTVTDDLVKQYPVDKKNEGLQYIREKYSGDIENKLATAYKQRLSELTVKGENARQTAAQAKAQFALELQERFQKGEVMSADDLERLYVADKLTRDQVNKLKGYVVVSANRTEADKWLAKNDPSWGSLTAPQKEEKSMRRMGRTPDQRAEILKEIQNGIVDGSVTDSHIKDYYNDGFITKGERDYYLKSDSQLNTDQKGFNGEQLTGLKSDVARVFKGTNVKVSASEINTAFSNALAELGATGSPETYRESDYRAKVMQARRQALTWLVEQSGKKLEEEVGVFFKETKPTKTGSNYDLVMRDLEGALQNVQEIQPPTYSETVNLEEQAPQQAAQAPTASAQAPTQAPGQQTPAPAVPGAQPAPQPAPQTQPSTPAGKPKSFGEAMLPGAQVRVTSGMNDLRDGGARVHNAKDYAAPMGTPITAPDFGMEMTVENVGVIKNGGNSVTLSGVDAQGRKVTMRFLHLQNQSPLKVGQKVPPGTAMGNVGSTGKSDGPHLHVDMTVNKDKVDPDVYFGTGGADTPGVSRENTGNAILDFAPAQPQGGVQVQTPQQGQGQGNTQSFFPPGTTITLGSKLTTDPTGDTPYMYRGSVLLHDKESNLYYDVADLNPQYNDETGQYLDENGDEWFYDDELDLYYQDIDDAELKPYNQGGGAGNEPRNSGTGSSGINFEEDSQGSAEGEDDEDPEMDGDGEEEAQVNEGESESEGQGDSEGDSEGDSDGDSDGDSGKDSEGDGAKRVLAQADTPVDSESDASRRWRERAEYDRWRRQQEDEEHEARKRKRQGVPASNDAFAMPSLDEIFGLGGKSWQ